MEQKDTGKTKNTESNIEPGNGGKTSKTLPDTESIKEIIRINREALKDKTLLDSDCNFITEVQDFIMNVHECLADIMDLPRSKRNEFVKLLGNMLVKSNLLDVCCEVVIHTYQSKWIDEANKVIESKYDLLDRALDIILNISNDSDEVAETAAKQPNFLETVRNILADNLEHHLKSTLVPTEREEVLLASIAIIHNFSMRDSNIRRLRALEFTEDLKPYLNSPRDDYRLLALASLAAIVNEKESEIINANQDQVKLLFEILQKAFDNENHQHGGWSCMEIALIIRNLAQNDANKGILVKTGALELLVKLGETGNQAEQRESVQAIWALTFDKETQKKIANNDDIGVVELLLKLKSSGNEGIKKACDGALWNLEEEMKTSTVQKYKQLDVIRLNE